MNSLMTVEQAIAYLKEKHGRKVSRRSVYNYVNVGVGGVKLAAESVPSPIKSVLRFSTDSLDSFVASVG